MSSNSYDPRAGQVRRPAAHTGTPVRRTAGTSAGGTVRRTGTQSSRTAVRPSSSAVRRTGSQTAYKTTRPAPKKKKKITLFAIIATIIMVFVALFKGIAALIKGINRKFDRFRKTEASAIVTDAVLGAAVLLIVLGIIALCFTSLRVGYGRILASFGGYEKALQVAEAAEREDGKSERVCRLYRRVAEGYIDDGKYDEALSALSALPAGDAEGAALTVQARREKAEKLYEAGSYAEAAQLFDLLSDTKEGAERYSDCLCCMAVEAYLSGNEEDMNQMLLSADGAENRIRGAIIKVTGSASEADRLIGGGIFNADAITRLKNNMRAVLDAQKNLPKGKIAVGDRHTVGLRSDGTVVACGDNSFGQCNVNSWTGIRMVAAGAKHTVALRYDGTVTGVGDNSQHQLDVGGWTDIVMIACSEYDTLGLKSDGTVVTCGMHNYDVSGWHGVTAVCGGSYSAGCLYNQGSMRSTHKGAQLGAGTLLSSLSMGGAYSAGVRFDGTLCSSFDGAPVWSDLVRVTASPTGIFAITNTGAVKSFFFRSSDSMNLQVNGSAVEIVSSGTHHVILTSDGRVWAFGQGGSGQLNTGSWNLN